MIIFFGCSATQKTLHCGATLPFSGIMTLSIAKNWLFGNIILVHTDGLAFFFFHYLNLIYFILGDLERGWVFLGIEPCLCVWYYGNSIRGTNCNPHLRTDLLTRRFFFSQFFCVEDRRYLPCGKDFGNLMTIIFRT